MQPSLARALRAAWGLLTAAALSWLRRRALWTEWPRRALGGRRLPDRLFRRPPRRRAIPGGAADPRGGVRFLLDAGVVVLAGAAAVWYFVLGLRSRRARRASRATSSTRLPVGDLVLLFASWRRARAPARRRRPARPALVAARSLPLQRRHRPRLGDLAGRYQPGGASDCSGSPRWRARARRRRPRRRATPRRDADGRPAASACCRTPACRRLPLPPRRRDSAWGARAAGVLTASVGVTALVLMRQFFTARARRAAAARGRRAAGGGALPLARQNSSDVILVVTARAPCATPARRSAACRPRHEAVLGIRRRLRARRRRRARHRRVVRASLRAARRRRSCARPRAADALRHVEVVSTNLMHDPNVGGIVVTARDVAPSARASRPSFCTRPSTTAHRPRESRASARRVATRSPAAPGAGDRRRALPRPRRLQARQRLARPRCGRPPADGDLCAPPARHARRRHRRPPRRRRVRGAARLVRDGTTRSSSPGVVQAVRAPVALRRTEVSVGTSVGIAVAESAIRRRKLRKPRTGSTARSRWGRGATNVRAGMHADCSTAWSSRRTCGAVSDPACAEFRVLYHR